MKMTAKSKPAANPKRQLDSFFAKYDPAIAAFARRALVKLRKRLPGATEMVYDNYNGLVIGFGPNDRASLAIFSIVLFPPLGNSVLPPGCRDTGPSSPPEGLGQCRPAHSIGEPCRAR
jgi:hypothetical protein